MFARPLFVSLILGAVLLAHTDAVDAAALPLSKRGGIDIDGDGKAELLVRSAFGDVQIGRLQNGAFQFTGISAPASGYRLVATPDINGNGKSDLAFQNIEQGDPGDVRAWLDFQSGATDILLRQVKLAWDVQAVGDLDGDGFGDLVWRFTGDDGNPNDTGVSYIWFTNGGTVTQVRKRGGAPISWQLLGAADLNGDGAADMLYVSPDGPIRVLMATAARTCANLSAGTMPAGFNALALADLTGQGRGDILIHHPDTGENGLLSLNASGVALPPPSANPDDPNASCTATNASVASVTFTLPATDPAWQFFAADDYNGDGVADIVWLKPDGTFSVWLMNRIALAATDSAGAAGDGPSAQAALAALSGTPLLPTQLANAGRPPSGYVSLKSVTAPTLHALSVAKTTTAGAAGSVSSSPAGIACGGTCTANFAHGAVVALTATPAVGSKFAGWGGACAGSGACQVSMSAAKSVTASFDVAPTLRVLTVSIGGTGSGLVSASPAGVTCNVVGGAGTGACTNGYADGTVVTLTAVAAANSAFAGWGGPCAGLGTCVVTMTGNIGVTANFQITQPGVLQVLAAAPLNCVQRTACAGQLWASVQGGNPPYHFAVDSFAIGAPPLGMTIDLDGIISGTPQVAGNYSVGFCAIDLIANSKCTTATVIVAPAPCTYALAPANQNVAAAGGSGSVALTTGTGCFWTAVSSNTSWLNVSPASGSANATISFTAGANTGSTQRSATITVGGQVATINQPAAGGTYAGGFTGSGPFANTQNNCTFSVTLSGTNTTTLTQTSPSLQGTAHVSGSWSNVVTGGGNCSAGSDTFDYTVNLSGTASNMSFATGTFPGVTFQGALNGSTIAGTMTFTFSLTTGSIVSNVALNRQP